MQSRASKIALAIGAVAVMVVLFVVLSDDSEDETNTTTTSDTTTTTTTETKTTDDDVEPPVPVITLRDGKPVGGVEKLNYKAGERVRFVVRSNADGEIHVHGFDIEKPVRAGRATRFGFPADIEGVFEVEDHGSGAEIARIRVSP